MKLNIERFLLVISILLENYLMGKLFILFKFVGFFLEF